MGSSVKAIIDTTIITDHLNAVPEATQVLSQYEGLVSSVTVMEVLSAAKSKAAEEKARELLSVFEVVHTNDNISEHAVELRREKNLKSPDAILYATAKHLNCLFVTNNSRDFSDSWEDIKIPYTA